MSEFRAMEYGDGNSDMIASLVTGFDGEINDLETAAIGLVVSGHDVVAYDYSRDVLESGEPDDFPQLINAIHTDFKNHSQGHSICRHAGVSLGMGIAINLQRHTEQVQVPAIYAAGGTNVAEIIYRNLAFNIAFGNVRKAFHKNGYDEQSLREVWAPLHESPESPFAVALGGMDLIVKYRNAHHKMSELQREGTPVIVKTIPKASHVGTIKWFNRNITAMLAMAETLVTKP